MLFPKHLPHSKDHQWIPKLPCVISFGTTAAGIPSHQAMAWTFSYVGCWLQEYFWWPHLVDLRQSWSMAGIGKSFPVTIDWGSRSCMYCSGASTGYKRIKKVGKSRSLIISVMSCSKSTFLLKAAVYAEKTRNRYRLQTYVIILFFKICCFQEG